MTSSLLARTPVLDVSTERLNDSASPDPALSNGVLSDSASSLRAVALKTLKLNRKRPVTSTTSILPSRSAPNGPMVQLDYGQGESASLPVIPCEMIQSSPLPTLRMQAANPTDKEDQSREEGEISDNETTPPKSKALSPSQATPSIQIPTQTPESDIEDIIMASPSSSSSKEPLASRPFPTGEVPSYVIDSDHVRPGLAMNQGQYDTAKDLVLDLLGWAVPPEHLIDCGLSREIVFYVFHELNLRLPNNFDATGLTPFYGDNASPRPVVVSCSKPSPPTLSPILQSVPATPIQPDPFSPKTSAIVEQSDTVPSSPSTPKASFDAILHDMEQRRRQELLARKAVQATRKPKPANSTVDETEILPPLPSPSDYPENIAIETTTAEFVEHFLNSIGPVDQLVTISDLNGSTEPHPGSPDGRFTSFERMELDVRSLALESVHRNLVPSPSPNSQFTHSVGASETESVASPSSAEPPPLSADSVWSITSQASILTSDRLNGIERESSLSSVENGVSRPLQRRGTKRPVAADFVDFEPGPSKPLSKHGYGNGTEAHPAIRRKTGGSFASVSGVRRCVIDLSDSEDESASKLGTNLGKISSVSSSDSQTSASAGGNSGWATPQTSSSATLVSPVDHLLEKELEIQRMRELIALREQSRKNKLVASSSRPTSSPNLQEVSTGTEANSVPADDPTPNVENSPSIDPHSAREYQLIGDAEMNGEMALLDSETPLPDSVQSTPGKTRHLEYVKTRVHFGVSADEGPGSKPQPENGNLKSPTLLPLAQDTSSKATADIEVTGQVQEQELDRFGFQPYDSLFASYPVLHSRSQLRTTEEQDPQATSSSDAYTDRFPQFVRFSLVPSSSGLLQLPNLGLLKLAASTRLLDPQKRVCPFEIPGGGVCRDPECEDIHLSQFNAEGEATDEEIAEHIYQALPLDVRALHSKARIIQELQVSQQRHVRTLERPLSLDECLVEVLYALNVPNR